MNHKSFKPLAFLAAALLLLSGCRGIATPVATQAPTPIPAVLTPTPLPPTPTPLPLPTIQTLVTVQAPSIPAATPTSTPLPAVISPTVAPPTSLPTIAAATATVSPTTATLLPTVTVTPTTSLSTSVADTAEALSFAVTMPPGFEIRYFAKNVPNARSMALGDNGTIFVGSRSAGNVYALVDQNGDQQADQTYTIAGSLNSPNGVVFMNNALYVAEINRIIRFDNIEVNLANPPAPVVVTDQYPADALHGWKYLRLGPDGYLYVPVGAPCNDCGLPTISPNMAHRAAAALSVIA